MKDTNEKEPMPAIQELSQAELIHVGGGFWPAVLALIVAGCATMPNKSRQD